MSTTYFIAGAVFIALSIIWAIFKWIGGKNEDKKKAARDLNDAIDSRDWDAIDDAWLRFKK